MLPHNAAAGILLLYLLAFFLVNAHNVLWVHRRRRNRQVYAEVERPSGPIMALAAFGTLIFFIECLLFVYLGFTGFSQIPLVSQLTLSFPCDSLVQSLGILSMGSGFFFFLWSVVARGMYSVSWAMGEDHRLVTWGPYRHVRHPSYLGYFLMFVGLLLTWLNPVALMPFVAIPGYVKVVSTEEELLIMRFGEEYLRYQKTVGRFLPRLTRKRGIETE